MSARYRAREWILVAFGFGCVHNFSLVDGLFR
jgi:hypothetical protein